MVWSGGGRHDIFWRFPILLWWYDRLHSQRVFCGWETGFHATRRHGHYPLSHFRRFCVSGKEWSIRGYDYHEFWGEGSGKDFCLWRFPGDLYTRHHRRGCRWSCGVSIRRYWIWCHQWIHRSSWGCHHRLYQCESLSRFYQCGMEK